MAKLTKRQLLDLTPSPAVAAVSRLFEDIIVSKEGRLMCKRPVKAPVLY